MEEFLSENLYWFNLKPSKSPVFGHKIGPKRCFSDIPIQKLPQTNENHISISFYNSPVNLWSDRKEIATKANFGTGTK